jgi:protein SCO1/2
MKNKSYIGISFIVLVFGILIVPKIVERFKNNNVVQNDRLSVSTNKESLKSDLVIVGKAPQFKLTNQDGKVITQDFYKDKVYIVEFFFSTCPLYAR